MPLRPNEMTLRYQIAGAGPWVARIIHHALVGLLHAAPLIVMLSVWYANDEYWFAPWGDALAISSGWLAFLSSRLGLMWLRADPVDTRSRAQRGESLMERDSRSLDLRAVDNQLRRFGWLLLPLWLAWIALVQQFLPPHAAEKYPLLRNVAVHMNEINGAPRTREDVNRPGKASVSLEYSVYPWNEVIYLANKAWLAHDGWRMLEDGGGALFCKDGMVAVLRKPGESTYGKYFILLEYTRDTLNCPA